MAVTVAIVPAFIVGVLSVLWNDLIEQPAQIADCPAFIFDGRQRGGRGRAENSRSAVLESALQNISGDLIGNVKDICIALCAERNGGSFYWHFSIITFPLSLHFEGTLW